MKTNKLKADTTKQNHGRPSLKDHLREHSNMLRRLYEQNGNLDAHPYACLEEFVLQHGRAYEAQPLPPIYPEGIPKSCYSNSGDLALSHDLLYVDGYFTYRGLPPIRHAWCVKPGDRRVIDITLAAIEETLVAPASAPTEYFGIPFFAETWNEELLKKADSNGWVDAPSILEGLYGISYSRLDAIVARDGARRRWPEA